MILKPLTWSQGGVAPGRFFKGSARLPPHVVGEVVGVPPHGPHHWLVNYEHITRLIELKIPYNWLVFVVVQRSCAASRAGSPSPPWAGTSCTSLWVPPPPLLGAGVSSTYTIRIIKRLLGSIRMDQYKHYTWE